MADSIESNFAKVLTSNGHQVLFYLSEADDEETFGKLNQCLWMRGCFINIALSGFKTEGDDERALEKVNQEMADRVVDTARKLFATAAQAQS